MIVSAINIILDNTDPQNPIFVEIEDDAGKSIRVGDFEKLDGNMSKIRITNLDMMNNMECSTNERV